LGFIDRIGTALVAPRRALSDVARGRAAGGFDDAALLLLLKFLCTESRALVAAGWMTLASGISAAGPALLARVSAVIGAELVLVFAAGVVITVAAGKRRRLRRDFDQAGVTLIPYLAVELTGSLVATLYARPLGPVFFTLVGAVALLFFAAMVVCAVIETRRSAPEAAP
jgi:hypothetical protein